MRLNLASFRFAIGAAAAVLLLGVARSESIATADGAVPGPPGLTYGYISAAPCLAASTETGVNSDTYSISFWYYNGNGGPFGYELRNVTPGSSNHYYTAYGASDGDTVIVFTHAFSGSDGTGTEVGTPKRYQEVSDCTQ